MISVIVPAFNAEACLAECLEALLIQTCRRTRYEILVVDDGSTDRTAEIARQFDVQLVQQPNSGPAAARNRGAKEANGEIFLFTDADCAPAYDWIEKMAAPMQDPEVVGVKGVYRTHQRELVARFVQLEYEDKYRRMTGQESIDFIDTYSAAYRRRVFNENGGFDVYFPTPSVEDQEFSFRLARKGYKLVFLPDAIVYHRHDTTLGQYWRRKFNIGYWKAHLLRWHPERTARDSHTPPALRIQIGLAGLSILFLAAIPLIRQASWMALASLVVYLLTTVPFMIRTALADPIIALIAPWMLLIRSLALGAGLVAGSFRALTLPTHHQAPISGFNRFSKRILDVLGSAAGLILSSPIIALASLAIKLDSPGPIFFYQERAGENGRPFKIVKLRTMVKGAENMAGELEDRSDLPTPLFKLYNDPRVTRIGRFLRHYSVDELPQLWNVLKGEMSLVGPRPEETRIVRRYSDWHRQRLAVKPGLTGPMQVNGRAELDLDQRVQLEIDYISNYTLWKDLHILARTSIAIISGRGAY